MILRRHLSATRHMAQIDPLFPTVRERQSNYVPPINPHAVRIWNFIRDHPGCSYQDIKDGTGIASKNLVERALISAENHGMLLYEASVPTQTRAGRIKALPCLYVFTDAVALYGDRYQEEA